MQTGTAAFANLHPETFPSGFLLGIEQTAELPGRVLGDGYHRPANYDLSSPKSKTEALSG